MGPLPSLDEINADERIPCEFCVPLIDPIEYMEHMRQLHPGCGVVLDIRYDFPRLDFTLASGLLLHLRSGIALMVVHTQQIRSIIIYHPLSAIKNSVCAHHSLSTTIVAPQGDIISGVISAATVVVNTLSSR